MKSIFSLPEKEFLSHSNAVQAMIAGGHSEEDAINMALQTRNRVLTEVLK